MEKILVMDEHNYDDNLEEIYRISVRGIIFVAGKLLMIESSSGEVILHNARIYRTALVKRTWLALCSQVTRKF